MQHSNLELNKKRQLQMIADALHALRTWDKEVLEGRWFECPRGAVKIDGLQRESWGFSVQDDSSMSRCKRFECIKRVKPSWKETDQLL